MDFESDKANFNLSTDFHATRARNQTTDKIRKNSQKIT